LSKRQMIADIEKAAENVSGRNEFLLEAADVIIRHYPHYTWVGFYFLKEGKLHVGPYIGKPTPHTVIDLDKGICGAAVSRGETIVVDDVNADPRYLACSLETKSEIVIPIRVGGKIIGELDIDSDRRAAFSPEDKKLMEKAAEIIASRLNRE